MENIIVTRENYELYINSDDINLRTQAEAIEDELMDEEWEDEWDD